MDNHYYFVWRVAPGGRLREHTTEDFGTALAFRDNLERNVWSWDFYIVDTNRDMLEIDTHYYILLDTSRSERYASRV